MVKLKKAFSRKKYAHKPMCRNSNDNKRKHKSKKNEVKKAVSKAMREKAEVVLTELNNCQKGILTLVKVLKTDSKEVEGGRCIKGSDGKLCLSEKEGRKVWKEYRIIERIMNEEND